MGGGHQCGAGCEHGAAGLVGEESGLAYSLYQRIDLANLSCLNEVVEGSGKTVFKPWESTLDREKFVESDADEELLINIPFTGSESSNRFCGTFLSNSIYEGNVKLKGLIVGGEEGDSHPDQVRSVGYRSW